MSPNVDPRKGAGRAVSRRTYYALSHSWGMAMGLLALVACLGFFVLPDRLGGNPAVEAQLQGWDDLYYGMYGLAGSTIIVGILRIRPYLEALGHSILLAGLCINIASIVATIGPAHSAESIGSFVAYSVGAVGRLVVVSALVRERTVALTLADLDRREAP